MPQLGYVGSLVRREAVVEHAQPLVGALRRGSGDLLECVAPDAHRYALTDPAGQLVLAGITRRRPHATVPVGTAGELPPCRGGIVELHLPAALLTELAAHLDACGEWAAVVADVAAQYTQYKECGWHPTVLDPTAQDPAARFAGAVLRRHVQVRDRACVFMGCRCTARSADLDHTVDHIHGGVTTEGNSGPLCRHDHRLKHVGGWRLHQPEPGSFTWTSLLGHTCHVRTPPIIELLPDPMPGNPPAPPLFVQPDDDWDDSRIWDEKPPEGDTTPSPRPPPASDPDEETPPF